VIGSSDQDAQAIVKGLGAKDEGLVELSVAQHFQRKLIERARNEGRFGFGRLRTLKSSLRAAYANWMSLLDHVAVPVLIYGEPGSGKRAHVDEFLSIQNFHRRLEELPEGQLRVFKSSFLSPGFTKLLQAPRVGSGDVIYLENIEDLSLESQRELLEHLKQRREFCDRGGGLKSGLGAPRLILGTEKALSLLVYRSEFLRELFQAITGFAVFLPSLQERSEDMPHIVRAVAEEVSGLTQSPSPWLVDTLARQEFAANLDDLKKLFKSGLQRNPDLRRWSEADLPLEWRRPRGGFELFTSNEGTRIRQALLQSGGSRDQAAHLLGVSRSDLLKKMMALGLR